MQKALLLFVMIISLQAAAQLPGTNIPDSIADHRHRHHLNAERFNSPRVIDSLRKKVEQDLARQKGDTLWYLQKVITDQVEPGTVAIYNTVDTSAGQNNNLIIMGLGDGWQVIPMTKKEGRQMDLYFKRLKKFKRKNE